MKKLKKILVVIYAVIMCVSSTGCDVMNIFKPSDTSDNSVSDGDNAENNQEVGNKIFKDKSLNAYYNKINQYLDIDCFFDIQDLNGDGILELIIKRSPENNCSNMEIWSYNSEDDDCFRYNLDTNKIKLEFNGKKVGNVSDIANAGCPVALNGQIYYNTKSHEIYLVSKKDNRTYDCFYKIAGEEFVMTKCMIEEKTDVNDFTYLYDENKVTNDFNAYQIKADIYDMTRDVNQMNNNSENNCFNVQYPIDCKTVDFIFDDIDNMLSSESISSDNKEKLSDKIIFEEGIMVADGNMLGISYTDMNEKYDLNATNNRIVYYPSDSVKTVSALVNNNVVLFCFKNEDLFSIQYINNLLPYEKKLITVAETVYSINNRLNKEGEIINNDAEYFLIEGDEVYFNISECGGYTQQIISHEHNPSNYYIVRNEMETGVDSGTEASTN